MSLPASVRDAFPVLTTDNYVNGGTFGPMPEPAVQALMEATLAIERGGIACRTDLGACVGEAREGFARMVGVSAEEIALSGNATDGIDLAVFGMEWSAGDEVITTEQEHEAVLHPLLHLRRTRGVTIRRMPVRTAPDEAIAEVERLVSDRTRLIVFSHVTCETGSRLPARELCAWAAARGIRSLVDCAQSVGALPVDARSIGCDFMTMNGHKWLCGPKGTGALYVRADRLAELTPQYVGAGSFARADFATGEMAYADGARRWEFGTRNWAMWAGMCAAFKWFEGLGWPNVYAHIANLAAYTREQIASANALTLLTPTDPDHASGLISFQVAGADAGEIGARLRDERIHTRHVPHYNATRITASHFTTPEDIDRCLSAALRVACHTPG